MINTNINIFDNTSIIYDIYNIKSYQRISKSHKRTENNQIGNLRGDNMETDRGIQEKDLRYRDKEWLEDQYINQRKSSNDISKICNCNATTVLNWLRKFDIKIRTNSESSKGLLIKERNPNWKGGKVKVLCDNCKKELKIFPSRLKSKFHFCSHKCMGEYYKKTRQGKNHNSWKGGKGKVQGYTIIYNNKHPRSRNNKIYEHILIMEKYLGRYLWKWEVIHHINKIKDDNQIENLFLCRNNRHHTKIHAQLERIAIELYNSNKFGKIKFDKEKGMYYIVYQNGDVKE